MQSSDRMVIDRLAAASKLRSDGVLGVHAALELHGISAAATCDTERV
jgi:hypothetical protein